jgi:hypothetical protein
VIRARVHRAAFIHRAVGVALALLTFLSPLLGSFHEAAVRHVACPEDGELIDAPAQVAHQHSRASGDGQALFAERDPAGPRPAGQDHDHCAVVLQAHLRARVQSRGPFVVTAPDASSALSVAHEAPGLRSLALYRLAPKASPPLA